MYAEKWCPYIEADANKGTRMHHPLQVLLNPVFRSPSTIQGNCIAPFQQ